MLHPQEIGRIVTAARKHERQLLPLPAERPQPASAGRLSAPGSARGITTPGKPATRTTQSAPTTTSGTGIHPWWRYQELDVPGDGRAMINVATGNLMLQDDDMDVAHKGIALAFRRTYNSQSRHDVNASDSTGLLWDSPGMYGNGWTNTFDAHLTRTTDGTAFYVNDIDGTRFDFGVSNGVPAPVAGNHTTLAADGSCGFLWTKKSGTTYYFYRPKPEPVCTNWPVSANGTIAGYAGRLYQIVGRNSNINLTFGYSWDNGDASATGKISAISVRTESGLAATLSFTDFSGHRLLRRLTFPDGSTSVLYDYDSAGNLTNVLKASNNAAGVQPLQQFGYQTLGTSSVIQWASSPRWCTSGCGADGAFTAFGFSGTEQMTSTVNGIAHGAAINPSIPDGTNSTVLQPGYPTGAVYYLYDYYTTGVSTPTYRDTDGHATNWIVDSLGRAIQVQECTVGVNQTCTGTYLTTVQSWDSANNLISETDPGGNETDYAYDPMGNTIAIAEPASVVKTVDGPQTFRPTQLFDYDQYSNVIAYCDQKATHAGSADWTTSGPPTAGGPDSLCSANGSSAHGVFTYPLATAPSYEPFGQLTKIRSPLGYNRTISYAAAQQGGVDYGLPTSVKGDPISQSDGMRTPFTSFTYDLSGNVICWMADGSDPSTTTIASYDGLNRATAIGDPDDASLTNGACNKIPGIAGSSIVSRKTYFADGATATLQTPGEAAANVVTQFQYDLDGNEVSETHHFTGGPATTQKWYDGADRLVEVQQPTDPHDFYTFAWRTRYIYDLTQGGTVMIGNGPAYRAYGGLAKTQELLPNGVANPQWNEPSSSSGASTGTGNPVWQDTTGTAYDALERPLVTYRNTGSGMMPVTSTYDGGAFAGLLTQQCNANLECQAFEYNARGAKLRTTFNVASSSTQNFGYDEDGRLVSTSNDVGSISDSYNASGLKTTRVETVAPGEAGPVPWIGFNWTSGRGALAPFVLDGREIAER